MWGEAVWRPDVDKVSFGERRKDFGRFQVFWYSTCEISASGLNGFLMVHYLNSSGKHGSRFEFIWLVLVNDIYSLK